MSAEETLRRARGTPPGPSTVSRSAFSRSMSQRSAGSSGRSSSFVGSAEAGGTAAQMATAATLKAHSANARRRRHGAAPRPKEIPTPTETEASTEFAVCLNAGDSDVGSGSHLSSHG